MLATEVPARQTLNAEYAIILAESGTLLYTCPEYIPTYIFRYYHELNSNSNHLYNDYLTFFTIVCVYVYVCVCL